MPQKLFYPQKYQKGISKHDSKPYTKIIMVDVETQRQYYTYVYSSCRNKRFWDDIIEQQHRDILIAFDNLTIKSIKKGIIDADCKPTIAANEPKGHLWAGIQEMWREDANKPKPKETVKPQGQFGQLFDIED